VPPEEVFKPLLKEINMEFIKVANIQMNVSDDKMESFKAAEKYLEVVSKENVDLVLLPEMFNCPYQTSRFPVLAEKEGESSWQKCSLLAKKYNIYLAAGSMPEKDEDGRVYNTAYVFDRQGNQIAKHRKVHLFDINVEGGQKFKESDTLTSGNQVTAFETEFGGMGICICYDIRFPELFRLMVDKGAKLILVPGAFNMTTGPAHWELSFRARALDNQVFVIGTAPARNASSEYTSWGHSIAVGPWGNVIEQMDEKEGYMINTLDLTLVDKIRTQLPLLVHRRKDVYKLEAL
jgi:omega-amidase